MSTVIPVQTRKAGTTTISIAGSMAFSVMGITIGGLLPQ
jgi:hypothetical protein